MTANGSPLNPEKVRQVSFLAILVILGWVLFRQLQSFIPAFLGALTIYVLVRKYMFRLLARKWKSWLAAVILMLASFLIIVIPIVLMVNMLTGKISSLIANSTDTINSVVAITQNAESVIGRKIINEDNIRKLSDAAIKEVPVLLNATFNSLATIVMMYFILYFMLTNGRAMENSFNKALPISKNNLRKVRLEIHNMVYSNAVGIPLIALFQGSIAVIGYFILGVKDPWFWFVLTCFTSMIPIVGASLAYVPIAIIFFANGETWRGVAILGFGFGVVSSVDSIFRFWLQKKIGDVPPLITVFGVIVGIPLFGFIGLIFGPLLISMFILLIKIYNIEFGEKKNIPKNT